MKHELEYHVGDLVKIESKILSVDVYKRGMPESNKMTGLIINIDACIERTELGYKNRGYIVSVLVNGGLGLWDFGTKYWKIWKLYK